MRHLISEQVEGPECHDGIHQTEQHGRTKQSQLRHENGREQNRRDQRSEIIERQHVGDHVFELEAVPQNSHEQRDLEADERSDDHDQGIQDRTEHVGPAEGEEERRRGEAADDRDQDLDDDELADEPLA